MANLGDLALSAFKNKDKIISGIKAAENIVGSVRKQQPISVNNQQDNFPISRGIANRIKHDPITSTLQKIAQKPLYNEEEDVPVPTIDTQLIGPTNKGWSDKDYGQRDLFKPIKDIAAIKASELTKGFVSPAQIKKSVETIGSVYKGIKNIMPSQNYNQQEVLDEFHKSNKYVQMGGLLDAFMPTDVRDQWLKLPDKDKAEIYHKIDLKNKVADYATRADQIFVDNLKTIVGDKKLQEMEQRGMMKEGLRKAIGAFGKGAISGATLGVGNLVLDSLNKHFDLTDDNELPHIYKENENVLDGINKYIGAMEFVGGIAGGFKTFGSISSIVGNELRNVSGRVGSFMAKHPVLAAYTLQNIGENAVQAGIMKATGQEYTFNDFLVGLGTGALFTTIGLGGEKMRGAILGNEIEATLKKAEETKGDRLNSIEIEQAIRHIPIGDGRTMSDLFAERRLAYLKGGKKGIPGIDYPAPLPDKLTEGINSISEGTISTPESRMQAISRPLESTSGTKKESISRISALAKEMGLSTEYTSASGIEIVSRAKNFVEKEPQMALKIMRGKELAPEGMTRDSIIQEIISKARTDNMDLLQEAVTESVLQGTRSGQELALRNVNDVNSVDYWINKASEGAISIVNRRYKTSEDIVIGGKKIKASAEQRVERIVKARVKKSMKVISDDVFADAQKFLDSLICK